VRLRRGGQSLRSGLIFLVVLLVGLPTAAADDVVTVRTPDGDRRDYVGEVIAYDSNLLSLRAPTGTLIDLAADDVVKLVTPRLASHLAGLRAWSQGDPIEAKERLASALAEEPRAWVRRDILAALVPVDLALADRGAAGTHFLALLHSDPRATDRLGLMPVPWGDRPPTPGDLLAARRWMQGDDDVERLMGAAVLVGDPTTREPALQALRGLSVSPEPLLAELARLMRWRAKLLNGTATEADRETARRRIDALPEALRAGPRFTLGLACEAAGRTDEAVAAYLFAPLVDPADPLRAAESLVRAGDLLRPGEAAAALRLWRECRQRFPFAPAAEIARQRIESLTGPVATPSPVRAPATDVPAAAASP
ncbi:MAG: hypothetical protein AAF907_09870, partial [Planctomycetota bacterium]